MDVEQACWIDFARSAQKRDAEEMIVSLKQLAKRWYLKESALSFETILNSVYSRVLSDPLWKDVKSEMHSLLVAYELQEFLSHIVLLRVCL